VTWSLTEKELKIISIMRNGKKMSAREIKRALERDGIDLPYTTISSILEKLHYEGVLERKEVRSRGRYGKKYLYYISSSIFSVDSTHPFAEMIKNVFVPRNILYSNDSVAFIDKKGVITFLYGNGDIISDERIVGRTVDEIHSSVTAKFVKQIFNELKSGKREFFRRVVYYEGVDYEKHYCAVRSSENEFLGVIILTRPLKREKTFPEEVLYL